MRKQNQSIPNQGKSNQFQVRCLWDDIVKLPDDLIRAILIMNRKYHETKNNKAKDLYYRFWREDLWVSTIWEGFRDIESYISYREVIELVSRMVEIGLLEKQFDNEYKVYEYRFVNNPKLWTL